MPLAQAFRPQGSIGQAGWRDGVGNCRVMKKERARQLGAEHVCNNRTTDVAGFARNAQGAGVDMVFDHVGTALFGQSLFGIGVGGRLVNCGNSSGDEATIPSLGYLFHSGISILGSDPYGQSLAKRGTSSVKAISRLLLTRSCLADAADAQRKMMSATSSEISCGPESANP